MIVVVGRERLSDIALALAPPEGEVCYWLTRLNHGGTLGGVSFH